MTRALRLTDADNIVVAIEAISPGETAAGISAAQRVPRGHKMAVEPIGRDAAIVKYGQVIGFARDDIAPGDWVHEHNVYLHAFDRDYDFGRDARPTAYVAPEKRRSFQGFRRANGKYGTRNYIAILTSVNCSASASRFIADQVTRSGVLDDYPNVDGVISLVHGTGCGLDVDGEAYELLKRTQWGFATNPNIGGVLMVGLGCEAFQIPRWMNAYGIKEDAAFRTLTIQEAVSYTHLDVYKRQEFQQKEQTARKRPENFRTRSKPLERD